MPLKKNLLYFSLFAATAIAHGPHDDLHHWEKASPDPDRIFLSFYGDSTTSRAVTWRTDTSVSEAVAQIAPRKKPLSNGECYFRFPYHSNFGNSKTLNSLVSDSGTRRVLKKTRHVFRNLLLCE